MRRYCLLVVTACLALVGPTEAAELDAIERIVHKEPTYESENPEYCLLVFGLHAETRVWMVLDGDVLYLDRNGNGDLTDPDERIAARQVYRNLEERPDVELMRTFLLRIAQESDEPILTCGPVIEWFYVNQLLPREDWHDRAWVKRYQERPLEVAVVTETGRGQRARLRFAASAKEAPIVHFDGPRRFALTDELGPQVFRQGETCELAVELHARGLNSTVRTEVSELPENLHPVAEIEFPRRRQGEDPIRLRVELKERC